MITINEAQFNSAQTVLKGIPHGVPRACSRAINRAAEMARTLFVRHLAQRYYITATGVRAELKIQKATQTNLTGLIYAKGPGIPLGEFHVPGDPLKKLPVFPKSSRPVAVSVHRGGQAQAEPKAWAMRKRGAAKRGASAFVLMARRGPGRKNYRSMVGPSIAGMLGSKQYLDDINAQAQAILLRRFDHEVAQVLRDAGRSR